MAEESHSFTTARARLEEIVAQVRKKETSLEKSLDLLEEGVRLANVCTEQIDHANWASSVQPVGDESSVISGKEQAATAGDEVGAVDEIVVIDDVEIVDADGTVVAEVIEVSEYESSAEFAPADEAWAEDFVDDALEPPDPAADEG